MYIPLHVHTNRSIGDSILKIDPMLNKAKELGMTSIAVTNHGSMSDIYEFHSKAIDMGIKPILGCEFYIRNFDTTYHLVVLAKNKVGFYNLIKLHNFSQLENFYKKPNITFDKLKEFKEGLIILTACVGGELPQIILDNTIEEDNKTKSIDKFITTYSSEFENFYLEIQPGKFTEQEFVNDKLIELSEQYSIPLVVTNDVHYLNADEYAIHNVHVLGSRKSTGTDLVYPDTCYYLMGEDELRSKLKLIDKKHLDEAINNTVNIADMVEVYSVASSEIQMPSFEGMTEEEAGDVIESICFEMLDKKSYLFDDVTEYVDRLYYELYVIKKLRFNGYFLTVRDYVIFASNNSIPTNFGRGSICSSLVAYFLGITKVDPIKYNLLFERFLSEHRKSVPDIDLDFSAERKHLVFEYIIEKYGARNCALVSTLTNRKSKSAIRDVGRVRNYSQEKCDHVASLIPEVYYLDSEDGDTEKKTDLSIDESIDIVPELKEVYEEDKEWLELSKSLCDIPKSTSVHPAGTLISPIDLYDTIPLVRNSKTGMIGTSLNLKDAESIGFIKFDILSIATLDAVEKIRKRIKVDDLSELIGDCDDEKVWDILGSSNLAGLFQVSSNTYKHRMPRLKPRSISELAASLALVRSPCISSGADKVYMDILEGKREVELIHPIYDEVTKSTNGIILFQEQLMYICNKMGFSMEESFNIMKASSKKKTEALKAYEKEFLMLADNINMERHIAERIFKMIVDCGLYCFNEAHAVGYALFCYLTAYLKVYYPVEFIAASLTTAYERNNDVEDLIQCAEDLGIRFLDFDINKSKWDFSVEPLGIRIGFCAVTGIGHNAYEELNRIRPISSMEYLLDNINRSLFGKKAIMPSILCGGFDWQDKDRTRVFQSFFEIDKASFEEEVYVQSLKSKISIYEENETLEEIFMKHSFGSKLEKYGLASMKNKTSIDITCKIKRVKKIKDKNKNNMAFVDVITGDGLINVTIFKDKFEEYKKSLKKGNTISIKVRKEERKGSDNYIAV